MTVPLPDLLAADAFLRHMGIGFVDGGPGWAEVEMTIAPEHISFLGRCHGGALFTLADTAFGLASNSREHISVGIDTHMAFARGAKKGDVVRARAEEVSRSRRVAVYRVEVTCAEVTLATFTGTVHVTERPVALPA